MEKTRSRRKEAQTETQIEEMVITPLKDWRIFFPPKYDFYLIEGKPVSIPLIFKQTLITENVIKEK
jgi:hypothetical protein